MERHVLYPLSSFICSGSLHSLQPERAAEPLAAAAAGAAAGRRLILNFIFQYNLYDPPVSDIKAPQLRMHAGLPRPRLWC